MTMFERKLATAFALAVTATLGVNVAWAQSTEEATSRIEIAPTDDGAMQWQVENRSYDVVWFWPAGAEGPRTLLIDQSISLTRRSDLDGSMDPLVRVTASDISETGALTPAWQIESTGEIGNTHYLGMFGEAYVTTIYGCCGSMNADTYFSLVNGSRLMTVNGELAMLDVPNSRGIVRLAGVETPWSAAPDPLFGERSDLLGIVHYVSLDTAIDRVALVLRGDPAQAMDSLMALPELTWVPENGDAARQFTHWALDGERDASNLAGVALRVTYTPEAWAEIPLRGDRLDLDAATVSDLVTLERLP